MYTLKDTIEVYIVYGILQNLFHMHIGEIKQLGFLLEKSIKLQIIKETVDFLRIDKISVKQIKIGYLCELDQTFNNQIRELLISNSEGLICCWRWPS